MEDIDKEIVKRSIEFYGDRMQSVVAMEECAELIQAISKAIRGKFGLHNMIEEIADVLIGIEILKQVYRIKDSDIDIIIKQKQERIMRRIEDEKNDSSQILSCLSDQHDFLINRFMRRE